MSDQPPLMRKPEQATDDELDRAQEAIDEIWPSLVMLVQHQNGTLTVKFQDGAVVWWDAAGVTRHKPKRQDVDSRAA